MHNELSAQLDLGQAIGVVMQKIQYVELAWAKVPTLKEEAADVPDSVGGAQDLEQGLVSGMAGLGQFHGKCLA
jgi:hypothetical protein